MVNSKPRLTGTPVRPKNPDYLGLKTQILPHHSLKNASWEVITWNIDLSQSNNYAKFCLSLIKDLTHILVSNLHNHIDYIYVCSYLWYKIQYETLFDVTLGMDSRSMTGKGWKIAWVSNILTPVTNLHSRLNQSIYHIRSWFIKTGGVGRPIRTKFWRCTLSFLSHLIYGQNMSKGRSPKITKKKICVS